MGERTSYVEGTPSWVELVTSDPEGARAFYGALFGWEFDINPDPNTGNYTQAMLHGKRIAGMDGRPAPAGMPTVWTTYFATSDAEKVAERITEHGGSVQMAPMDVMDYGRMAIGADPSGATFGLWQAGTHTGSQLVNEPGAFCWNELNTRDLDGAAAFYEGVLGVRFEDFPTGEGGPRYKVFHTAAGIAGGAMDVSDQLPAMPPFWSVYFDVEDANATVARVTELGGSVLFPVTDSPQGPVAGLTDPQGGAFSIIALTNPAA